MKLTFVAAAFALLAAPVFADTMAPDMTKMMCKDLMAADEAGMMAAGVAAKGMMKDDAKMQAMSDADVTMAAETACKAHPDAMVMDAMHM